MTSRYSSGSGRTLSKKRIILHGCILLHEEIRTMIKKVNLLVIVVGLLLVSPLALAGKPDCKVDPTHGSCKDPLALPYLVAVYDERSPHGDTYDSELYHPSDHIPNLCQDDDPALAQAHSHMTNFNGFFERGDHHCADLTYDKTGTGGGSDYIKNISFQVTRDKKSGAIVSVSFGGQRQVGGEALAFISFGEMFNPDLLPDGSPRVEVGGDLPDGVFIIHLHADNVDLKMCDTARVIGRTECNVVVGKFAVEDILYTPNLEAE